MSDPEVTAEMVATMPTSTIVCAITSMVSAAVAELFAKVAIRAAKSGDDLHFDPDELLTLQLLTSELDRRIPVPPSSTP